MRGSYVERASVAVVAQLVEHELPKLGVAGSNPVRRSDVKAGSSRGNSELPAFVFPEPGRARYPQGIPVFLGYWSPMSLPPLPFQPIAVRRLHRPTPEEFRQWHYREPVLVSGLLEECKVLGELRARTTLEDKLSLLGEYFRDRTVEYCVLPPESGGHYLPELLPVLEPGHDIAERDVPFARFAERLKAAPTSGEYVYMMDGIIDPQSPLRQALQFDFLTFADPMGVKSKFWIGSNGQVVNLHYDDFINFICMFEGTKRVTMFPPEQMPNMYHAPFDTLVSYAPASHVQLLKPDLERYPKFRTALEHAHVAVVEPGDVLLVPPFWWHHVESFSAMHVMYNNFVTTTRFANFLELFQGLSADLRALAHSSQVERAQARESFHRAVLGDVEVSVEPPLLERARQVARKLSPAWRKHMTRLYDEFVFQVHGDPFLHTPGGLDGFLARHAQHPTLSPLANFLIQVPEMLDIPQADPNPQ
jgi:hypothetical protein